MLTFSQSTGQLRRDGALLGFCYSGRGTGLNNPAMHDVHGNPDLTKPSGPLPCGVYTLQKQNQESLGPLVFYLNPDKANNMFGRSNFFIHWDNQRHNFSASEGCIVPLTTWTFYALQDGEKLTIIQ